jgi:hypothetical protein
MPSCLPLPRDVSDFTGRQHELADITAALTRSGADGPPVVLITGPPGYGKTSVALRAAALVREAFPEQVFVDLGGRRPVPLSAEAVTSRILSALTGQPGAGGGVELLRRLVARRPLLLVLDDAAAEDQVRAVLPAAGRAAVLVTSRRSLAGLDDARRVWVDRLSRADAVRLLTATISPEQAAGSDLGELAGLCDDVPLALRIAANHLASRQGWTVERLTARLAPADRRLDTLTAGDLSLRASIGTSFAQLPPPAQRLFRRLALVDGATFDAGLAGALIGEDDWGTDVLLDQLVDRGLLQSAPDDRYTLATWLRLYAGAELAARELPADREAIRAAADDWLLTTATHAARLLRSSTLATTTAGTAVRNRPQSPEAARAWLADEAENWIAARQRALRRGDRPASADPPELAWYSDPPPQAGTSRLRQHPPALGAAARWVS